ncbi:hypothetical protein OIU84_030060 [Salix udensis]|uniref:Sulfite exporter TauE/SafE family protein n=1 Tax=Salix udensis TaxID=889485 RepID=A0AAD6KCV6_9ROSI|nr:hypothetical protein OIU84_030060 [Salix udensis]
MDRIMVNQRALASTAVLTCLILLVLVLMANMASAERLLKDKEAETLVEKEMSPGTSTKALFKGIDTWKKESVMKKEAVKQLESESKPGDGAEEDYRPLPSGPVVLHDDEVPLRENIRWKELALLVYVWVAFLVVQIVQTNVPTCSVMYWILNSLQVPIAASVTLFEAICLCKGTRVIASKGKEITNWKLHQVLLYCSCGIIAGIVGGLLGLGGGFILGPLFLELGIPPQVASATSTFAMAFSSSMSVVEYYLLNRFPVPYAAYFVLVATIAAFAGQHVIRRIIAILGRASIIIFILALTIFVSAISLGAQISSSFQDLEETQRSIFPPARSKKARQDANIHFDYLSAGGVGIANMVEKLENDEYMGFENLCYQS